MTIVCSDITRNGKTLLARLYADLYSLRKEGSPVIFDTDLSENGIVNYFPQATNLIDLSRIAHQVSLFDTMLAISAKGNGPDFIVDVAANELKRFFFRIFNDIGFERGAFEVDLDIQICHVISWTMKSLKCAANIRDSLSTARFVAVRNMAIEALPFTPAPHEEGQVPHVDIDLFLNALSPEAFALVNDNSFSFAKFVTGNYDDMAYEIKADIWNFLEDVYNQTRAA